jgi:hypothetical protein
MTHISGEKSKRGEIRFPKTGIAIFMSILNTKRVPGLKKGKKYRDFK